MGVPAVGRVVSREEVDRLWNESQGEHQVFAESVENLVKARLYWDQVADEMGPSYAKRVRGPRP